MKQRTDMTLNDLDRWIRENPKTDKFGRKYYTSRYKAFREIKKENPDMLLSEAIAQAKKQYKGEKEKTR